jgi:cytidyltransferase-like protein
MSESHSKPVVLVAGFFDMLHSGHIRFFEEAAKYGRVIVSIGSDDNSLLSKGRKPVFSEKERQYMVESIRFIDNALVSDINGPLSFSGHLEEFQPDYFIINYDGHTEEKKVLCESRGVKYVVLERIPKLNFTPRNSTDLCTVDCIPHRLDLAGGFFDQKKLNSLVPGSAVICNIEAMNLVDRAGMSSSTRRVIHGLFGNQLPKDRSEQEIANIILAYENFDSEYISGATDAYGLVFSSVCKFEFRDSYRPHAIEKIDDNNVLSWLENHLYLKLTHPRRDEYDVFDGREAFPMDRLREYAEIAHRTWEAVKEMSLVDLKQCINKTRAMQQLLIPGYVSGEVSSTLDEVEAQGHGVKLMGAGGAGYMVIAADQQPPETQRIVIRRSSLTL